MFEEADRLNDKILTWEKELHEEKEKRWALAKELARHGKRPKRDDGLQKTTDELVAELKTAIEDAKRMRRWTRKSTWRTWPTRAPCSSKQFRFLPAATWFSLFH